MRVLHVSMPTTEGVPTVLMSYVSDQVGRGWPVAVACPDDGWLADAAAAAGADVLPWAARRSPGPGTAGELRRLATLVRDWAPDLVHLHSAKAGLAGRAAVRGRVPTVFQPHAWSFLAVTGPVRAATVAWERWAARWTGAFVWVSEQERLAGVQHGVRGSGWVVPNGVDVARFSAADGADRVAARARLGLGSEPLAVCVGRISVQKGQRDLLDAWPAVRRAVTSASVVFVGDGPDRAELETHAGPGVSFAGNRSDVPDWLAAANVVVAASRWEGMALAPLEAMARARYVVATDVAGIAESVPPSCGSVVPAGSQQQLVAALARALADPEASDAAGRQGREHVAAHHDAAAAAATVASGYASLVRPRD